jgi:glycerol uptake facilitator-like aquaporin
MKFLTEVIMTAIFFFTISALIDFCPKEYQSGVLLFFVIPFLRVLDCALNDGLWSKKSDKLNNF